MKLKVGVLSMQKVINYGSFLQAYALKKILESLDSDVYFIDIKPGEILPGLARRPVMDKMYKRIINAFWDGKLLKKISGKSFRRYRNHQFQSIFFKMLGTQIVGPEKYDVIVIGSDEVFNVCHPTPWGFTTHLFGEGLQAKRIVSYAASFGTTTIEEIERFSIGSRIKTALENISMMSVRDQNSFDIIKQLTGTEPKMHFDPVLVYDWPEIKHPNTLKDGYIIVYSYQDRITREEKNAIADFARNNKKELISLYSYYDWCDKNITPKTPLDVITYFKYADFIVTDTFHGTIFSIINRRPFCTIVRNSNKNKLDHLLEQLCQTDRKARTENDICRILTTNPQFTQTESILLNQKTNAYTYLKECLSFKNL